MRITDKERAKIKEIFKRWSPDSDVYLFGSMTDMNAKGGDIDLLTLGKTKLGFKEKLEILVDLNIEICEQKYDIVSFTYDDENPFKMHIVQHAILL